MTKQNIMTSITYCLEDMFAFDTHSLFWIVSFKWVHTTEATTLSTS